MKTALKPIGHYARIALLFIIPLLVVPNYGWSNSAPSTSANNSDQLSVLDGKSNLFDNRLALSLAFSDPLIATEVYDRFIRVTTNNDITVEGGWIIGDNPTTLFFPHVLPSKNYTIHISSGITSENGNKLTAPKQLTIKTGSMAPAYDFLGDGFLLPSRLTRGLPVMTVNVPAVDVEFLRVRPEKLSDFLKKFAWTRKGRHWDTALDNMKDHIESVHMSRFTTEAPENTRTVSHIPVEDITPLERPGLYIAVMSLPGRFGKFKTTHFFVSDIGLHARQYKDMTAVFTASLKTGQAISDVQVQLLGADGKEIKTVWTVEDGVARLPSTLDLEHAVVVARKGLHFSVLSFSDPALDLSEFPVQGKPWKERLLFPFSERDLYRPGEDVRVSFLLRNHDGQQVANQPIHLQVKRPDGQRFKKTTLKPHDTAPGYYQWSFTLPDDAPTGQWHILADYKPKLGSQSSQLAIHVEAFMPERMRLEISSTKQQLISGQKLPVQFKGNYLFGPPTSGNQLEAVVTIRRNTHPIESLTDFHFGDITDGFQAVRQKLFNKKMSAAGLINHTFNPLAEKPKSPLTVRITGDLFETGGRTVSRSIDRTLWPADTLVGLRPLYEGDNATPDGPVSFEVIRIDHQGNLLPADGLSVTVVRELQQYYWHYQDAQGWSHQISESHYPTHRQKLSFDEKTRGKLTFSVKYGGYRLEIIDPSTGLKTAYRFHAGWDSRERSNSAQTRPDQVSLQWNKAHFTEGEAARLKIDAPHPGPAIVVLENGNQLLWKKRVYVPEQGMQLDIPIKKGWARHDLYAGVVLYRPGTSLNNITPNRAIGLIHLPIDRSKQQLKLSLNTVDEIKPNATLSVGVKTNLRNQQTNLILAAVDVGVLNITDFATPDPFGFFFAKRRYAVENHDLYGKVIEAHDGPRMRSRFGGDAALSNAEKKAVAQVRIVSLFSGPIVTDEQGMTWVSLEIPEYNGSLRLMAIGFGENQFGKAEKNILVRSPLVVQAGLPRFLSYGDQSVMALDLHNLSGAALDGKLNISATDPLLVKPQDLTIHLDQDQRQKIRIPISTNAPFGTGDIYLTFQNKEMVINRTWSLMVRPSNPFVRRIENLKIAPNGQFTLSHIQLDNLIPATAALRLTLSTTPPLDIQSAVRNLLSYPYGCLEQTTSRLFPLIHADPETVAKLGIAPITPEERLKRIDKGMARLMSLQKSNGAFGLWRSQDTEQPWLTAFAVDLLLDAQQKGIPLPDPAMLDKGLNYLFKFLQNEKGNRWSTISPASRYSTRAYAAQLLSRVKRAPLATLRRMLDQQAKEAPTALSLIQLAVALHAQGDKPRAAKALKMTAKMGRNKNGPNDYGSLLRDLAWIHTLTKQLDTTQKARNSILLSISNDLEKRHYLSTQERYALFRVALSLVNETGDTWSGSFTNANSPVENVKTARLIKTLRPDALKQPITFTSKHDQILYGQIVTSGHTIKPPQPVSAPITLQRKILDQTGKPISGNTLKAGEKYLVHIHLTSKKPITHGLVEDLLPAGLELENMNLTHGEKLGSVTINGKNPAKAMSKDNIRHIAYLDDRFATALTIQSLDPIDLFYLVRAVTPGTYTLAPTMVEDMYHPEIRAIGADAGTLVIEE
ncbi:MAG: alpha-2-macroglobulin family protein [Magnetococcales bacterium]|nr:alpha-2-macroglobulin family protein [Magnetococcales bacterium]